MAEHIEDDALLSRMNGKNEGDGLTEEGKGVAMLLDRIAENPELLEEDPKLKEFYEFAVKAKDGKVEGDRIIIEDKMEEVNKRIQEEFGYESFDELVEASKEWKKGSDQFKQWETLINNAPPAFGTAVSLLLNGSPDWDKAIALNTTVDFSKPINTQSKRELVKFYFPNQFTEEELNTVGSAEAEDTVKKSLRLAESFFEAEARKYSENIKRATENQKNVISAQKKALEKNKESLKKKYPFLTEAQTTRLITALQNGSYARHFLNADGIFTERAAENILALEMPDVYIKNVMGATAKDRNKDIMGILDRNAAKPELKGQGAKPKTDPINQAKKNLLTKRNTYTATPFKQ